MKKRRRKESPYSIHLKHLYIPINMITLISIYHIVFKKIILNKTAHHPYDVCVSNIFNGIIWVVRYVTKWKYEPTV